MQKQNFIRSLLRTVPDFPKPGILFYDITTVLSDPRGMSACVESMIVGCSSLKFDLIAGIESRGFIFASALSAQLRTGLLLLRKPGKLPGKTHSLKYALEYGESCLELSDGVIKPGQRVLLVDDLLATGGTAAAACQLITMSGAEVVAAHFLIELPSLSGRERIHCPCHSVLQMN